MLQDLKQKINQIIPIKYTLTIYLGLFLIYSSLALGAPELLGKGLFIVVLYSLFDLLWTYARDRVWYLPVSSWISGFILALVAIPNPPLGIAVLLPFVAVASKQLLWFGKMRHIFNPAALSMGALAVLSPSISWWGVAWGTPPLIIATVAGIVILWRQGRWHVTLPFLASYAFLLAVFFLLNGTPPDKVIAFLRPQILDGTVIFFATVMLIEPLTSTLPARKHRIIFGCLAGFFALLITYLAGVLNLSRLDPLIYGLLLANVVASILFLPSRIKSNTT
jgi:Na+-translocating ferredoxin:NAD+ oxidoreductase RnfD subunit